MNRYIDGRMQTKDHNISLKIIRNCFLKNTTYNVFTISFIKNIKKSFELNIQLIIDIINQFIDDYPFNDDEIQPLNSYLKKIMLFEYQSIHKPHSNNINFS